MSASSSAGTAGVADVRLSPALAYSDAALSKSGFHFVMLVFKLQKQEESVKNGSGNPGHRIQTTHDEC